MAAIRVVVGFFVAAGVLAGCASAPPATAVARVAGPSTATTPVGFVVTPVGSQQPLGDLPLAAALSPDGRWLVVSDDGEAVQALQLVDAATGAVVQTISYPAPNGLFVGLAFAPDGRTLYASGGGQNVIRRYTVRNGTLAEQPSLALPTVSPTGAKVNLYPAGITLTPDGQRMIVADEQADAVTVLDLATGATHTTAAGHHPYSVTASDDGHSAYVTNLGSNTVSVFDLTGQQ